MNSKSIIIFGWKEKSNDKVIDPIWLKQNCNNINTYPIQIKNGLCEGIVYGIECDVNIVGSILLDSEYIQNVIHAYTIYSSVVYSNDDFDDYPILGYYLGLITDNEIHQIKYIPCKQ
jgi:hypothetical protein